MTSISETTNYSFIILIDVTKYSSLEFHSTTYLIQIQDKLRILDFMHRTKLLKNYFWKSVLL
jgi:hypothetical protein